MKEGGRIVSSWGSDILEIHRGVGLCVGSWFDERKVEVEGDGTNMLFWSDQLLEYGVLHDKFRQLFDLSENNSVAVLEMCLLGLGVGKDGWKWKHMLLAWEEE